MWFVFIALALTSPESNWEWHTGKVAKVEEGRRFIPAVEQQLGGVAGQWGNSTGVQTGVTRRYAAYAIVEGSHLYVVEEQLKKRKDQPSLKPGVEVRYAIVGLDEFYFEDSGGKLHKAVLVSDRLIDPNRQN
jgi:hypothetical protein